MQSQKVAKPQPEPKVESSRERKLDQELEDSFPASDPPQSTQPRGHADKPHRSGEEAEKRAKHPRK